MKIPNAILLLLCGASIGWLIGLSSSPVIQTVIGSLLAIITSALTLLLSVKGGELKDKVSDKLGEINIFPLTVFLIGLSTFATIGVYARTNDWLGVNPQSFKQKWKSKDTDSSGIIKELYKKLYSNNPKDTNNASQGVLFNLSEDCKQLLLIDDYETLSAALRSLSPEWQLYVDSVQKNIPEQELLKILKQKIIQNCQ